MSIALGVAGCVGGDAPDDPYRDDGGRGGSAAAGSGGHAGGAGEEHAAAGVVAAGSVESHFPLAAGAKWTYRHTTLTKEPWNEVATMSAGTYEDKPAFILEDQEDAQGAKTRSTFVVDGTGVYRAYREVTVGGALALKVSYDPAFLRYDEAWSAAGQSETLDDDWVQTCVMTSVASKCAPGAVESGKTTHKYTVVNPHVSVTVPAGTFDCVEIERFNPDESETRRFWFSKGVGKVREEDAESGATEELADFVVPS